MEMKTLNGYEVVDAKAREDIKNLGDTTQQRLAEIETAIPSLEGYATEEYVDEAIEGINTCTTYYFDPEAIEWQTGINNPTHAPDDLVEFAQKVLAGEHVNLWIKDPYWQPTRFAIYSNDNVHFQRINTPYPGTEQNIQPYQVYLRTDGIWAVYKLSPIKYFYADDDYVNTAIRTALSGIAQAEGGAY